MKEGWKGWRRDGRDGGMVKLLIFLFISSSC